MENIYLALSGLNSLDPVALIGTTTKYEFNDIHNWTSHVFIACAREDIELETVQTVMKHLRENINFAQFDDSTIRDMIINLSTIFSRKDLTQKAWYARFIIDLLRTRDGESFFSFRSVTEVFRQSDRSSVLWQIGIARKCCDLGYAEFTNRR